MTTQTFNPVSIDLQKFQNATAVNPYNVQPDYIQYLVTWKTDEFVRACEAKIAKEGLSLEVVKDGVIRGLVTVKLC